MKPNNIRNIVFDLSEVLLTGIKDTGIALAEKHKLEVDDNHRGPWSMRAAPLLTPLVKEFFNGNVSEAEYLREVIEAYPRIGDTETLKRLIRENFIEIEGTREVVLKLRELGYRLALLSVHAKEWIDYCEEKFDFHKLFDVRAYSYEAGVSKPDAGAFEAVLRQLGSTAGECLFIDDSKRNIEAADALGFSTILFTTADELRVHLRQLLPNFE